MTSEADAPDARLFVVKTYKVRVDIEEINHMMFFDHFQLMNQRLNEEREEMTALKEIRALIDLRQSEYVVLLDTVYRDEDCYHIVTEFTRHKSLADFL